MKKYFGNYGGQFVPETLLPALSELEHAYEAFQKNTAAQTELALLSKDYLGRKTPLYFAGNFSKHFGFKIYLKREDLLHGGAHKTNNGLGMGLLARFMGKKRIIAETGAGQHGAAIAMIGAFLDIPVEVYMGVEDIKRQHINVMRMQICGAKINPVEVRPGIGSLKDATNAALRDWVTNVRTTFYIIGSVVGPHPYPTIVRDFQAVIGREIKQQILEKEGRLPSAILACVGGGSNAIGAFHEFLEDTDVRLIGLEPGGKGVETGEHGAALSAGKDGILHGSLSRILSTEDGQAIEAYSVSAGLDYPGVGPEHAHLAQTGRVRYYPINDKDALDAFYLLSQKEGSIPALESAHAIAYLGEYATTATPYDVVVINLSGRGDKDVDHVWALTHKC